MYDVRTKLGITVESPYWEKAYSRALSEPTIPEWLTEEFIHTMHRKYGVLKLTYEPLLAALPSVTENEDLCLLAKTVYHILETKLGFSKAFTHFEMPDAPKGTQNTIGYDCFIAFPILGHIMLSWHELSARGIPDEVCTASLMIFDELYNGFSKKAGRPAFPIDYFKLYGAAIYVNSLIIGRLRFEMKKGAGRSAHIFKSRNGEYLPLMNGVSVHRSGQVLGSYGCEDDCASYPADFLETEASYEGYSVDSATGLVQKVRTILQKDKWSQVFSEEDDVIAVHIPYGGKLDREICQKSYADAREIFSRCYPERDFKCFLITCWMLSPELKSILPPESGILAFGEPYLIFPVKSRSLDAFHYVYAIEASDVSEIDIANLPETNTLTRGVKKKSLEGKYIYEYGGFLPF